MTAKSILISINETLKSNEVQLHISKATQNAELRKLLTIGNYCHALTEKLTVMRTNLKEWTEEILEKDMTAERKRILTKQLKKIELALNNFDILLYDFGKLHNESTTKWKANASYQSVIQESITDTLTIIDTAEKMYELNDHQRLTEELPKLRARFVQMTWISQKIAEQFQRLEGSQLYSDQRLTEFNDKLDKVCREFNATRSLLTLNFNK